MSMTGKYVDRPVVRVHGDHLATIHRRVTVEAEDSMPERQRFRPEVVVRVGDEGDTRAVIRLEALGARAFANAILAMADIAERMD